MTPDRAVNSGSKPDFDLFETPASAENAVVAANSANRAPGSERTVRIFSHSAWNAGANGMGQASWGCAANSVSAAVRSR
ncbi:hypothetical protein SHKM778_59750 [Streptomyces sp. KM77-8]|uniref:Uncharacterized protein n=1 Tax=Streptomyces haneummycinicus TaxID=3074435 RepID=A0AAT9HQL3_9ACTN